ncbi:MAG TPA: HlyD family efflux transporter periplasmic adaptor subunit [Phenylobacterium sp.]|nr:HlyD family efflux transporter periplasmic adaptor subunit [Phenylobacterium sp.]
MRQRLLIVVLLLAAAALVAALVLVPRFNRPSLLSGYVEGEPLYLASPVSGAVTDISVQRGDRVVAGQRLFVIDPSQVAAQRDQARAEVDAAASQARDARKGVRPVELAVYEANVSAAEARARDAEATLRRVRALANKGYYAPARLDDARSAYDAAAAQLSAARRQRDSATLGAREDQVRAADSRVDQARAGLNAADARLSDIAPTAPAAARVEEVFFQKGEWAVANQPVVSLLPDDRTRVRFFVPETSASAYTPGKTVRFACDGCAAGLTARIVYVSPRPEFTPPVIYSREARDRLVYLVEARPSARLNPGQPVDVTPLGPVR